jgi:hypothetical protein
MILNVTERVSASSVLHPKCTDVVQARITTRFRSDSSIGIGTPKYRDHGSEQTTVWRANRWQHNDTEVTIS